MVNVVNQGFKSAGKPVAQEEEDVSFIQANSRLRYKKEPSSALLNFVFLLRIVVKVHLPHLNIHTLLKLFSIIL